MPRHAEEKRMPYEAQQMFDLVADVESYPSFLPWCRSLEILAREGDTLTTEMTVGFKALRERFRTQVVLQKPTPQQPGRIDVRYLGGPLSHLTNAWRFSNAGPNACEIAFTVDFAFRSKLFNAMMGAFFESAFCKMVSAFEARAAILYGKTL